MEMQNNYDFLKCVLYILSMCLYVTCIFSKSFACEGDIKIKGRNKNANHYAKLLLQKYFKIMEIAMNFNFFASLFSY